MSLTNAEIKAGVVAYFDVAKLNADPAVSKPQSLATRNGPFVCFATNDQSSAWVEVSTQYRDERLPIKDEWRKSGSGAWKTKPQYFNDGKSSYADPKASFVAAAVGVDNFTAANRPRVTDDGVAAILAEVIVRDGPLI